MVSETLIKALPRQGDEALTTASGRSLVRAEINRNEQAPLCGVATIEVADPQIGIPRLWATELL